ncbi:hypothetical protein KSP40_PGU022706 [Platanthera guangdongensis]|uniref:Uncharacterized protein n=1 Tax=Platanthera guangdongensis TaxID=2320717 RepID=A0ABR2MIP4_9ASPA
MEVVESAPSLLTLEGQEHGEVEYDEDEEDYWSSESEVGDALDWLDSKEGADGDGVTGSSFSVSAARRPNAHGGLISRPFQPLTNRSQKFASHIRANPLEEWEGRMDIGMSNSVTTAIRETVRDAAIGRIKNTEKADRATVEQVIVFLLFSLVLDLFLPLAAEPACSFPAVSFEFACSLSSAFHCPPNSTARCTRRTHVLSTCLLARCVFPSPLVFTKLAPSD